MLRPRALLAALVAVLISSAAQGSGLVASASPATAGVVRHTYRPSAEEFANPERGFYRYSEAHLAAAGGRGFSPLDAAALAEARRDAGVTLVFRYYYLDQYRTEDTITTADLARIATDLDAVRTAGLKIIVRFAYSDSSSADAPVDRVVKHILQLAPVLNQASDVIEALQAGFIGQWGEWYYTDNFASDPSAPWQLSAEDWAKRRRVLLALLDATAGSIRVQVRTPAIKQHILPDAMDPRAARVGIHDDCFLASADDYGTFATAADRTWLAQQSASTTTGGETCAPAGTRSLWPSAAADLTTYHWSFLNGEYHPDVLASWGAAGRSEAARRLGYRLRLTAATLPSRARAGARVRVTLSLTNDGYAAPLQSRPVHLVMRRDSSTTTYPLTADTRTWAPGRTVQLTALVPAPPVAGRYQLHLDLPDSSPALRTSAPTAAGDSTHSAYAVRLANTGTWETSTGWNDLGQVLVVTP